MATDPNFIGAADTPKPEPLSDRVVRGGAWNFSITLVNKSLSFIRTIILARLLAPEDFGLFGLAFLSLQMLENFTQTGLDFALIQTKKNIQSYLNTAWTVSFARGCILFFSLYLLAPLIAKFFNAQGAVSVIRVVALSILINGSINVGIVFFHKELRYDRLFTFTLSYTVIDFIVSLILAFVLKSVWALVWGSLAGNLSRLIFSYAMHSYRPRIRFDKNKFYDLFGFSKWLYISMAMVFLILHGDDIVVAKMVGTQALGLYQMAYLISNLPSSEISRVLSQVIFPAYSKLQDEIERLKEAYLHVLQLIAYITTPLSGGIFILAPELIPILLGEKWISIVPSLQILSIAGFARSILYISTPVLQGIGKPRVETLWQFFRTIALFIVIFPLTVRFNILGTSYAVLISIMVSMIGISFSIYKILKLEWLRFFSYLVFPIINTIAMVLGISLLKHFFNVIDFKVLLFLILIGMIIYFSITFLLDKYLNFGVVALIRSKIKSL